MVLLCKIVNVFRRLGETEYSDDPAKVPDEHGNLYIPKEWPKENPEEYTEEIPQQTQTESKNNKETECHYCKKPVTFIDSKSCKFCSLKFCMEHIQLEKHDCGKSKHTKYVRKTWLRKYGLNISTGRFKVVCDSCGYNTDFTFIETAGRERENHIQESGCQGNKVFLEGEEV